MGPKWLLCPEQKLFGTNHCHYFHLTIGHFHCAKFKKIITVDPELWRCTIFGPKMVHLHQTNFLLENYYYHSHLPISPFHCAKFKKNSSSRSRVMNEDVQFLGPKWLNSPNDIFSENLFMRLVSFIHAYLQVRY